MLTEYYFEIQYIKGTKNATADALSRKAELQNNEKPSGAMLKKDKNRLIRYNHPKLAAKTKGKTYKTLESNQL